MNSALYVWDKLKDFLSLFGFFNKTGTLIFIGLDDAGKTTLIKILKTNVLTQSSPTTHANSNELKLNNITFKTYDLGGHKQVRKVWKEYFQIADAIVFLIDASKLDRFEEARTELEYVLNDEELMNCPILILANKIDKRNAVNEDYIRNYFNLYTTEKMNSRKPSERPIELFMCSLLYRQGYGEGFRWLSKYFN